MNRTERRQMLQIRPFLDKLESRRLMSLEVVKPRFAHELVHEKSELASQLAGGNLGEFALGLAQHPKVAVDLGLGALSLALREHAGYAKHHGWAASLVSELTAHPRYAEAHHLMAAIDAPQSPPSSPVSTPTQTTVTTTTVSSPSSNGGNTPTPIIGPVGPSPVIQEPLSVAVGGTLDVTLPNLGLGTANLTYTITPQPLPANMSFNRETGQLTFTPAPGQAGVTSLSVAVSNGSESGTIVLPVTVTNPTLSSTAVSGQVVDENGNPLAGMPVTIGSATTVTNSAGDFTLWGVPANPGPISVGGALGTSQGRLDLTAPVAQLLGHDLYANANNAIPGPLVLPKIVWSTATSFSQTSAADPVTITNPAIPGLQMQMPASASALSPANGTLQLAQLPAALAAQHMPAGASGGLLLYYIAGSSLSASVQLTLPNTEGFKPGAVVYLLAFNPLTGGHDVAGQMIVSASGETMTSTGSITLSSTSATSSGSPIPPAPAAGGPDPFAGCLSLLAQLLPGTPTSSCAGCEATGNGTAPAPNTNPPPAKQARGFSTDVSAGGSGSGSGAAASSGSSSSSSSSSSSGYSGGSSGAGLGMASGAGGSVGLFVSTGVMDSDAGLVTGQYFLNNQLVSYQSQGQEIGINLQYSSGQADPNPVVQYQFTTPLGGDSSSITSINAQVSIAGVVQGDATTYNTPDGLTDGETYDIPLQVDASDLPTGVYTYTITLTENFGSGEDEVSLTGTYQGSVNVVNESSDPLGAGWSVGGLQELSQLATDGPVLITAGQQGTESFQPTYTEGQTYVQDLALASGATTAQIMPNSTGTGQFSASETSSDTVVGTVSGDFNGDGEPDLAVVTSFTLAIELNNDTGGFTAGDSYTIPSGYEAKGIVAGNFTGHDNGDLDLAVLLYSTSTGAYYVAVYTGDGTGSFATPVISAAGNGDAANAGPNSIVAGDFNGDGKTDVAFNTDNGLLDVMLAGSDGSMGSATALSLPSGHEAIGVTSLDYNGDGDTDLVVQVDNTNVEEDGVPFVALDLFAGDGSGAFSYESMYQTVGEQDVTTIGLVAGDFQGPSMGLEVAVPVSNGGGEEAFLDIVPLSDSGTWGNGVIHYAGPYWGYFEYYLGYIQPGNIVAGDLNGSGKPSIALTNGGSGNIEILLADPASNQFLPLETANATAGSPGMLAVAPFMGTAAAITYNGPTSDPSTLVQNENGSWTRRYPDGTVIQFNSSGKETSITDVNGNSFTYTYVTSGAAAGALATITDPVGLTTTVSYNESGYVTTIVDPAERTVTLTVGEDDDLTSIEEPNGSTTTYGYSTPSNHLATTETDPDGNTATAHYNSFGQLTSETLFGDTGTTDVDAALSNGLLAPGDSGSLSTSYEGSVTDPDGRTTTVAYNWMSHPTGEDAANGGTASTTYDSEGFPVAVTDALGRTVTSTYDSAGDVTSITEPFGGEFMGTMVYSRTETIAYDEYGVPTSVTDFNGNTTTFMLDDHGNVLEEEQPGGVDQEWTYNSAGQVLTYTDGDGATTTYTYNDLGRLTEVQEPGAGSPTIEYGYDSAGDVTSITDPEGDTETFTYNSVGELLTEQNPVQAAASKDVSFSYDADGNLLTETDADGNTVSYTYNARGEEVSMTDGMERTTSYGYDADGNLITVTDPTDDTVTYSYTSENEVASITDPTGGTTTYGYDLDGEETSVTDANGFETTYSYDNLGLVVGESEETKETLGTMSYYTMESIGTYVYDPDGNLVAATDGDDHTTSYTYNDLNEMTEVENADDNTTQYSYDDDGNVLTVTDGDDHTTSYTYNDMGQVLTETQPSGGGTTSYVYDVDGRLVSLTDPDDNTTDYSYNGANEVVTEESPTGGLTTITYDLDGNVLSTVDPDDHEITYAYDADNELTGETWVNPEGGTPLDVFDYTYNSDGELTAVSDDNSSYQYTYNADGEETSQSDVGSPDLPTVTLTYDYDADGDRTSMDDSLGGLVSYTYNPRDELTNETLSGTDISAIAVANSYDNAGNMTGQTRYSNLAETDVVASTAYTYDDANQMTGITDKNSSGTTLVSYGYTYGAAGLVTQETRTWDSGSDSDTLDYTYTDNDQLTGVTHTNDSFANESFSYDANGNETGTGYTTSTGNEQTGSPGYTYTYDADCNMITSTNTSTGDTWTYSYNFAGQMTVAVETNGDDTVLSQTTYTYDALGNRIGMDENGTQTWTLYDGSDPIMDFNGSGSLEMRYLNGPTGQLVDSVLARESSGGTVAWYLPDRLGTIRDLINNSGSIIDHIDFSAFGTVLDQSDPSEGDRMMGFAGMELDSVTGMNLAVYRVQSPGTGRWTSQDPLGFVAGDANLDRYVANDPVEGSDTSGLEFGLQPDPMKWRFTGGPEAEQAYFQELLRRLGIGEARLNRLKASALWGCLKKSPTLVIPGFDHVARQQGGAEPRPLRGETHWNDGKLFMTVNPFSPENKGNRQLLYAIVHEMMHAALMLGCKLEMGDGTPIGNPDTDPNAEKNIQKYLKRILDDPIIR